MKRRFKHLDLLIHIFVIVLMISNLVAPKIVAFGPLRLSGAQLLFPITYIFGDIFTEVYGYAASRRAIWIGFLASALLSAMGLITVWLPPAPDWQGQEAFATVFYVLPRIIIASLIAYWAGEFTNAYVMAKMKLATRGRHLWMRTIGSTAVGQFVDTVLVITIIFAGSASITTMLTMIGSGYIGKVLYEAAMTPVTYAVVNGLKKVEGVEVFDENTDFSPFHSENSGEGRGGQAMRARASADCGGRGVWRTKGQTEVCPTRSDRLKSVLLGAEGFGAVFESAGAIGFVAAAVQEVGVIVEQCGHLGSLAESDFFVEGERGGITVGRFGIAPASDVYLAEGVVTGGARAEGSRLIAFEQAEHVAGDAFGFVDPAITEPDEGMVRAGDQSFKMAWAVGLLENADRFPGHLIRH
jgi:uncharacterized integral membrane protein (TIGR00697 family)